MSYKSNTVDIVRISKENDLYEIFANTNTINKFMVGTPEDYDLEFSPLDATIEFYDRKIKQDLSNIDYRFRVLVESNWYDFTLTQLQQDYELLNLEISFNELFITTGTQLIIHIQDFYEVIAAVINENQNYAILLRNALITDDNGIIKIQWYINNELATEGLFLVTYGLSSDAAQFNINANSINASIDNGFLEFTSNGLQLHNGGLIITADNNQEEVETVFEIRNEPFSRIEEYDIQPTDNPQELGLYEFHQEYIPYTKAEEDTNPSLFGLYELVDGEYIFTTDTTFIEGKTYYEYNESYTLTTDITPQSDKTYYQVFDSYSLYLNGSGTFSGNIYADNGYFHGELRAATGTFSGMLQAATGSFSGRITAQSGYIGGFFINDGFLNSESGEYTVYETTESDNPRTLGLYENVNNIYELTEDITPQEGKTYYSLESGIILNGSIGLITAEDIILGTGARVRDYIALGNAFLYNPDLHNGVILEAGDVTLTQQGDLSLGDLTYNSLTNTLSGGTWSIDSNKAIFWNVDVKGTLHTSVFETGKIQAVGGGMLFAPASKFEIHQGSDPDGADDYIILASSGIVGNTSIFKPDDVVMLSADDIDNNGADEGWTLGAKTVAIVDKIEGQNVYLKHRDGTIFKASEMTDYETIIFLSDKNENQLVIGVNAFSKHNWALYPQGFSFIEPDIDEYGYYSNFNKAPTLFLGNLESLSNVVNGLSGYGLYGENVFLNGSLTTKMTYDENDVAAGINGLSTLEFDILRRIDTDVEIPEHLKEDKSPIIFYAGAQTTQATAQSNWYYDIQNAVFQISQNGTIYAQNGYFADSVIVNAQIGSSIIRVPAVYGSGARTSLKLTDLAATGGISLVSMWNDQENEIYNFKEYEWSFAQSIHPNTQELLENPVWIPFITFNHNDNTDNGLNRVTFIGKNIELNQSLNIQDFSISKNGTEYNIIQNLSNAESQISNQMIFSESDIEITHYAAAAAASKILLGNQIIELEAQDVYIQRNISLGNNVDITLVDEGGFNINIA